MVILLLLCVLWVVLGCQSILLWVPVLCLWSRLSDVLWFLESSVLCLHLDVVVCLTGVVVLLGYDHVWVVHMWLYGLW